MPVKTFRPGTNRWPCLLQAVCPMWICPFANANDFVEQTWLSTQCCWTYTHANDFLKYTRLPHDLNRDISGIRLHWRRKFRMHLEINRFCCWRQSVFFSSFKSFVLFLMHIYYAMSKIYVKKVQKQGFRKLTAHVRMYVRHLLCCFSY